MPTEEDLQPAVPPNKSSSAPVRKSSKGKTPTQAADGPVDESDDGPATAPGDIGED
jgi:hypothetical protein